MSRPLISAEDVRAARRRRETRLAVPEGAIVTPLARDEAARHGIDLVQGAAGETAAGDRGTGAGPPARPGARPAAPVEIPTPSARRHVPTCDALSDPVERVVDRVLARVPGADPAQVREIARRVLGKGGA